MIRYIFLFISIAELSILVAGVAIAITGNWDVFTAFHILTVFVIPVVLVPWTFEMYRRLGRNHQ